MRRKNHEKLLKGTAKFKNRRKCSVIKGLSTDNTHIPFPWIFYNTFNFNQENYEGRFYTCISTDVFHVSEYKTVSMYFVSPIPM
jgi:hypothetical protein